MTEMQTVMTSRMKGTAQLQCAQQTSFAAVQGVVCAFPGGVMEKTIALITVMKRDVRRLGPHSVLRTSSCAVTAAASDRGNCAME